MGSLKDKLRMAEWVIIALVLALALWHFAPAQLPVVAYKALLVTFFAFLGYWIDRRLFPYNRPFSPDDGYAVLFDKAELRRAIIVAAVIVAGALAL